MSSAIIFNENLFHLRHALPQTSVDPSDSVTSAIPATEATKQPESSPSVKPVEDASQPSSIPNTSNEGQLQQPLQRGWGFFSYVILIVGVVISGLLTWWMCLGRVVKSLIARRKGKDHYRRVDDEEK